MFSISRLRLVRPERAPDWSVAALCAAGDLVEVRSPEEGAGRTSFALVQCAARLAAGEGVFWVGPPAELCLLAAFDAGAALERLVVVRTADGQAALKAADLVLACEGAAKLVVAGLAAAKPSEGQLVRLQRRAEKSGTAVLLLDERPSGAPPLGAVVARRVEVTRRLSRGTSELVVEVVRNKSGPCGELPWERRDGSNRLRLHRTL